MTQCFTSARMRNKSDASFKSTQIRKIGLLGVTRKSDATVKQRHRDRKG